MKNIFYFKNKPWKILIVDDEEDICHYLKSILEKTKKFQVWITTDPAEGITLAKSNHPDLVLLDIIMPGIDGSEVAERLKSDPTTRDILIVFLSVLALREDIEKNGGVIGGHPFIAKSFTKDELITRLEELLQERSTYG